MSKQENTSDRPQQPLAASTPSRITRTNPNRTPNIPPLLIDPFQTEEEKGRYATLPNKVSTLDKNVIFQDLDKKKSSVDQSNSSSRGNKAVSELQLEGEKTMGLVSNAFLVSASKFVRGGGVNNNMPTTPRKAQENEPTPQDTNKTTPFKFSRSKDTDPKATSISMKEPQPEESQTTNGSNLLSARKIERRQAVGREFRFAAEKKEEKVENTVDTSAPTVVVSARKTEKFKIEIVKIEQPPQEQSFQRVYQPIQRQNPYARSRIMSDQPVVQKEKQTVTQKPKQEVAKPINRLVQSRLQSQLLSQSKVTPQPEVEPPPTNALNRISQSRVVTQVTPQVVQKEEIKPKLYTRSFISRKPEAESKIEATQPLILPAAKQTPVKAMQHLKIVEDKSKSQIKESVPEASDVKILLKKTACIGLVGKRLIRSRLLDGFGILKSHKQAEKVKKVNQCQLLYFSISNITKSKETNLIKAAFENIKKKFTNIYVASLKSFVDQAPTSHKNAGVQLIDRIFSSKMREHFKVLKTLLQRAKNRSRFVTTLQSFHRRKVSGIVKDALGSIRIKHNNLPNYLNKFSVIYFQVNKIKLVSAFARIAAVKPVFKKIQASPARSVQKSRAESKVEEQTTVIEDTSNPALVQKLQKLRKGLAVSQGEVSGIEISLGKKKKGAQLQKGSISERVTVLKHQNEQMHNEIEIKKHRSAQIKKEMESVPAKKNELEQELTLDPNSKLQLLTNIYISNFKNSEERLFANDLLNNYRMHTEDKSSVLFNQWECILRNVQLKRVIAAYEGVDQRENKGRANLASEQGLISHLIRSYVKEQYFWQWIHLSAT